MPFIIGFGNIVARDDCNWRFSGTLEQKHSQSIVPDRLAVLFGVKCSCLVSRNRALRARARARAPCSKRPSIPIRFIGLQVAANGLDQRLAWPQFKPLSSTVSQSPTKSDPMHDQAIYSRRCFFLGWEIPPTVSALLDSPLLSVLSVCFAREIF